MSARNFRLLALLYFASGMAGLIDEVAFFKYLSFTFGATAHASSAVLVSFMGGLAIGAFLASAFEGRVKQPLVVYGVIEIDGLKILSVSDRENDSLRSFIEGTTEQH